ncbi:MAG TPA: hypothetical protein VHA52_03995, partial [Candidatus Babeliaceae bacterium]|nr:hypothetical protein [Candidatus Babeliaceae bacterium]
MIDIAKQTSKSSVTLIKQRNYNELVEYLDKHWSVAPAASLERMKALDQALGTVSQKVNVILVAGTNGKSLTVHFAGRLLKEEGVKVGTFYFPHILTYNERLAINQETISNKAFTEVGNEVLAAAESLGIEANSQEILTMMALAYFAQSNVDVAVLEVHEGGSYNPANICHASVVTITRVTPTQVTLNEAAIQSMAREMMGIVKKGTHIVSGDQSKANLQLMEELTEIQGGHWAMPIRKLASLSYPFEQLHG